MDVADQLHDEHVSGEECGSTRAARTIVAKFMHELNELDPVVSRIILWRYGWRCLSDQAIAARIGWPVERVVAVSDQVLRDVWARVAVQAGA